jgi:cytidylate kinase
MSLIIAIDGPSASGKSTVSQRVAQRLNFIHVDSGALYRGVTWYFLSRQVNAADNAVMAAALKQLRMDFRVRDNAVKFSIDGIEPDVALRSEAVNNNVSQIAARPDVRAWIVNELRKMPAFGDLVMEGRDIGTAVFPEATFKFYLDATPEERARRRYLETVGVNKNACHADSVTAYDDILRSILKRDGIDSSRATAPLKVAPGAVVIQSTKMSVDEVVDLIVSEVQSSRFNVHG